MHFCEGGVDKMGGGLISVLQPLMRCFHTSTFLENRDLCTPFSQGLISAYEKREEAEKGKG